MRTPSTKTRYLGCGGLGLRQCIRVPLHQRPAPVHQRPASSWDLKSAPGVPDLGGGIQMGGVQEGGGNPVLRFPLGRCHPLISSGSGVHDPAGDFLALARSCLQQSSTVTWVAMSASYNWRACCLAWNSTSAHWRLAWRSSSSMRPAERFRSRSGMVPSSFSRHRSMLEPRIDERSQEHEEHMHLATNAPAAERPVCWLLLFHSARLLHRDYMAI
ncbi:hypothetical protein PVAP13_1KG095800 [Panicum virgatum]|uniref:Uncharacterized protein n=1 Tax=Panicum virgatum TaxID=38727 RepID=A0A8T0XCT6_PANVG|nr:hypothetical protein PVAP13_1KG095800 [Panicum virgatum]